MARWLSAAVVLALAGCGSDVEPPSKRSTTEKAETPKRSGTGRTVSYQVDNPTADPWRVELDGTAVGTAEAYSFVTLTAKDGSHAFRFLAGSRVVATLDVDFNEPMTILNPTGEAVYSLVTVHYPGGSKTESVGHRTIGTDAGLGEEGKFPMVMWVEVGKSGLRRKVHRLPPTTMTPGAAEAFLLAGPHVYAATDIDYERAFTALEKAGPTEPILKALEGDRVEVVAAMASRVDRIAGVVDDERVASWLRLSAGDAFRGARFDAAAALLLRRRRGDLLFPAFEAADPNVQSSALYRVGENPELRALLASEYFRTLGAFDGRRQGVTSVGYELRTRIEKRETAVDAELARAIDEAVRGLAPGPSRDRWRPWWLKQLPLLSDVLGADAVASMMYAEADQADTLEALIDRGLLRPLNARLREEPDADRRARVEARLVATIASLPEGASAESLLAAATDGTSEAVVRAGLTRLFKHGKGHLQAVLDAYARIERARNRAWLVSAATDLGPAFEPMLQAARTDADAAVRAVAAAGMLTRIPSDRADAESVWNELSGRDDAEATYAAWIGRWIDSFRGHEKGALETLFDHVKPSMEPVKEKKLRAPLEAAYLEKLEAALGSLDASEDAGFERMLALAVHESERISLAAMRRWPHGEAYAERLPVLAKLYPKLKSEPCRLEVFQSMMPGTTQPDAVKICERGLKDKSAAVRLAAFQRLYRIHSETADKNLATKLKNAARAEKDKETKERMQDMVSLLPK